MFILPFVLRVLSSKDPQAYAQDLLELCSSPGDTASIGATTDESPTEQLMRSLWDDVGITRLRLRYVLALWASVSRVPLSRIQLTVDSSRIESRCHGVQDHNAKASERHKKCRSRRSIDMDGRHPRRHDA